MKTFKIYSYYRTIIIWYILVSFVFCLNSCDEKSLLEEKPLSSLNSDIVLTSKAGFQNYIIALVQAAREEQEINDKTYPSYFVGTDVVQVGFGSIEFENYNTYLTPATVEASIIWDWAYTQMILRANTIIVYANKPELKTIWSEAEKNAVIAEARFFRGYTYNLLANMYGGVPIVDTIFSKPKTDFVRSSREQVYEFAEADLEFASQWLPTTVDKTQEGRIVKGAADHLLSEVYISLGKYDKAIASATLVINSGLYNLMTTRFGNKKDQPGDVFSDLFIDGNQNRSSGNLESIYVRQFEEFTVGGAGTYKGNHMLRSWIPFSTKIKDPKGKSGIVPTDSLGRGTGFCRPTNYFFYDIWKDNWNNDIRNSPFNIRRKQYYTNPASTYFGKLIEPKTSPEDTLRNIYPCIRKVEGKPWQNDNTSGRTPKDVMVYRLAETYLLRAEAYLRKGDVQNAAKDINVVRARANAKLVVLGDVTLDYILDERARELITEEPRRRTLIRMGKLVERVRKYALIELTRTNIQDKHGFFPIPQTAIDANFSAILEQNPGY